MQSANRPSDLCRLSLAQTFPKFCIKAHPTAKLAAVQKSGSPLWSQKLEHRGGAL
jgi:hypothetical protein